MNWKKLSYMRPESIRRFQNNKLRWFLRAQIRYSPFYSKLFKSHNIRISSIKTTDDLHKIPFTTKLDIAPSKNEPKKHIDFVLQPTKGLLLKNAPFRAVFSRKSLEYEYRPVHIHFTTGRSSAPVPFLYTLHDINRLQEAGFRLMEVFGVSKEEFAVNAFPYFPHLAFWQTYYGMRNIGMMAIHTGGGKIMGSERIIHIIENSKANLLAGMPGYSYHLIKLAAKKNKNFSSVKHVLLGGEPVPDGLRAKLVELLRKMGAKKPRVLSTYAFTEGKAAWAECRENSGYHLYPDMEFIELVDKNEDSVGEGEPGEIIYTSLDWRGSVVLRYKTGDFAKGMFYEKCPHCGRTVPRIDPGIERESEYEELYLTKVKGSLVNLNLFSQILMGHPRVEEWQLELRKKNNDPYEVDEIDLYVAPKKGVNFEKLKTELESTIKVQTEVTPKIIQRSAEEIEKMLGMETELKEKRIVDKRVKKG